MQNQNDDFPYTSDDPALAPTEQPNAALSLTPQQISDLKSDPAPAGRFFPEWNRCLFTAAATGASHKSARPETIIIDANETYRDRLKYLVLGILFRNA